MFDVEQGHEGCGTVIEVGSEAKGFKPGDKVGWLPIVDCCFDCEECQVFHHPKSATEGKADLKCRSITCTAKKVNPKSKV